MRQVSSSGDVAHKLLPNCIPRDSSSSSLPHLTLFLLNTWLGLGTTLGRLKERFIAEVMGGIFIKYVTAYLEDLPAYLNFSFLFYFVAYEEMRI